MRGPLDRFEAAALLDGRTATGRILRRVWSGPREVGDLFTESRLSHRSGERTLRALVANNLLRTSTWRVLSQNTTTTVSMVEMRDDGLHALRRALRRPSSSNGCSLARWSRSQQIQDLLHNTEDRDLP